MTELDDHELLAQYARTESEAAFATLVARYVNLVYSAAFRFTANPHQAEEITQAVFIILARKAGSLRSGTVLSGWLYQTARLTAANFVKSEFRRQQREQEAYMQSTLTEPEAAWEKIAPLLDEAMGRLGETDRNAVVSRFFENKTTREVGAKLKLNEAAAHKRVNRAVDKLRKFFTKRGVTLTATVIAGAVSANSIQAAPVGMALTISTAVVKGSAIATSTLTLAKGALKLMSWTKAKMAFVVGVGVLLAAGTTVVMKKLVTLPMDAYLQDSDLNEFQKAPPMVALQNTHFAETKFLTWGRSLAGKSVGRNMPLSIAFEFAYHFHSVRTILLPNMPTNRIDFLVTTPDHLSEKFQAEIKRQFGLIGRIETIETNVLLLQLGTAGTNKLKVSPWPKSITRSTNDPSRFVNLPTQPLSSLSSLLENEMNMPVIDQTGLTNFFDIFLEWQPQPKDLAASRASLKEALHDQFGLELISTNQPIEMLIVEKVK